jgi:hypothetical protein
MKKLLLLMAVTLLAASPAWAALDMTNPWTDPDTGITFAWTEHFESTTGAVKADIDYVVKWVPGVEKFKYSYQIKADGTSPISRLSIPMLENNKAEGIGFAQTDPNDIDPKDMALVDDDNAWWSFDGLNAGDNSSELYYYSINRPMMFLGSVVNGGLPVNASLPSPTGEIPEPMTLSLLAVGGLACVLRKRG